MDVEAGGIEVDNRSLDTELGVLEVDDRIGNGVGLDVFRSIEGSTRGDDPSRWESWPRTENFPIMASILGNAIVIVCKVPNTSILLVRRRL